MYVCKVMAMYPRHWAWRRQRAQHHAGALRADARNLDFYDLRGPNESPRGPCDKCAEAANTSFCLSFSSSDDDDDIWVDADEGTVTDLRCLVRQGIS